MLQKSCERKVSEMSITPWEMSGERQTAQLTRAGRARRGNRVRAGARAPQHTRAREGAPPPLPYKVDTSRPSLRTNWTRLVPFPHARVRVRQR